VTRVRSARSQVGSSTTELVLLMPLVLLMIMLVVQAGLWWHARQVVEAAAQEALEAAQTENGDAAAGQARGESFLAQTGGVRAPSVAVERTNEQVTVEVHATAPHVVPGLVWQVTGAAQGPAERFVSRLDR